MSEIQEIDVFINPDGTVKLELRGVKGGKCLSITRNLEKTLGNEIVAREMTDEFNETPNLQQDRDFNLLNS